MFKCLLCDKEFPNIDEARKHIKEEHKTTTNPDEFIEYKLPFDIEELEKEITQVFDCCWGFFCVDISKYHKPIYPELEISLTDCRSSSTISLELIKCIIDKVVPVLKKYGIPEEKLIIQRISNIPQYEEDCTAITITIDTEGVWDS